MATLMDIIPFWGLLLILFLISIIIYTLVGLFFEKYLPHFFQNPDHSQVASGLVQIISLFYGLILGFLIIILWQNFEKLQNTINGEATALATILRSSAAFPTDTQIKIQNAVQRYLDVVLNHEWPRMKRGNVIADVNSEIAVSQLYNSILFYEPQSTNQQSIYDSVISQLDRVIEARRTRLDTIHYNFPAPLLSILLVGSIILIVFLPTIAGLKTRDYQHFLKISICCYLVFNLSVILSLKYPFSGKYSISNTAFREGMLNEFNIPNRPVG